MSSEQSDRLAALEQRLTELETKYEQEREQRQQLETFVTSLLELRGTDNPTDADLEQIWLAGHPIGAMVDRRQREVQTLRDDLEEQRANEQLQQTEIPAEQTLPIQQITRTYQVDPDVLSANERRAAIVWSHFLDTCERTPSKFVLPSSSVRDILATEEESRPHNETVRRVIDLVDDLGDTLVEELTRNDRKTLVIDRDQFQEFSDELQATIETTQPHQEVAE